MQKIKNIRLEDGVDEIFQLKIIESDSLNGTYTIQPPDGIDDTDFIVDINEETFNVENMILGDSLKLKIYEYYDNVSYNLVKNVYEERGGDSRAVFIWKIQKENDVIDLLNEDYEINFNKYVDRYGKSGRYIEFEVKKRESQNKFYARKDKTVDLFATKNIDNKDILPIVPTDGIYKESDRKLESFWYYDGFYDNDDMFYQPHDFEDNDFHANQPIFPRMRRSDDSKLGAYLEHFGSFVQIDGNGPFLDDSYIANDMALAFPELFFRPEWGTMLYADANYNDITITISNLKLRLRQTGSNSPIPFKLYIIKGYKTVSSINDWPNQLLVTESILSSNDIIESGLNWAELNILDHPNATGNDTNSELILTKADFPNLLTSLNKDEHLRIMVRCDNDYQFGSGDSFKIMNTGFSIKASINATPPSRRVLMVNLKDAIDKVSENISDNGIRIESDILSTGIFNHQYISTGQFLRGAVFKSFLGQEKLELNFENLFEKGASKLIGLGYDVYNGKIIVEDLKYWFKDIESYDFTDKDFIEEETYFSNDNDLCYNSIKTGTKKYSTQRQDDIKNFNTYLETQTPIISKGNTFDLQSELIVDEKKIQELILDNSSSTNNNDDDIILIDCLETSNFIDRGAFNKLMHFNNGGYLWLQQYEQPWDTIPIVQYQNLSIINGGLNIGTYQILEITPTKIKLNKTTNIETGVSFGEIEYGFTTPVIKSRVGLPKEGILAIKNILNKNTSSNLLHNPKYQLARWFPFFSGMLKRKKDSELLKTLKYKNNGKVKIEIDPPLYEFGMEGLITLEDSVMLETLRNQKDTFFTNGIQKIRLSNVSLFEFLTFINNWRMGMTINGMPDRKTSRGYVSVNMNGEIIKIYPLGNGSIKYYNKDNELEIMGKIKNNEERKIINTHFRALWDSDTSEYRENAETSGGVKFKAYGSASITEGKLFRSSDKITWIEVSNNFPVNSILNVGLDAGDNYFKITAKADNIQFTSNILHWRRL